MRLGLRFAVVLAALVASGATGRAEDESPAAKPAQSQNIEPLTPGANSFAESQARVLLQKKGYADVSPLVNDKDGIWHGTAAKDGRRVNVSVDFRGHVAER